VSTPTKGGFLPKGLQERGAWAKNVLVDWLAAHREAQEALQDVLRGVAVDQFHAPTPCAEWTVRDVVMHVVAGNRRMADLEPPDFDPHATAERLVEEVAASAAAAQERFAAPDGLTRSILMPFGHLPGSVIIRMRSTDVLTHAWDLARASGQPTDLAPRLAEELLADNRERVRPEFRGPGRPFGPEQPCDPGRPPADRLAAFLGRSVG
jgi:uncharacterized protein (TIGR03086 family)